MLGLLLGESVIEFDEGMRRDMRPAGYNRFGDIIGFGDEQFRVHEMLLHLIILMDEDVVLRLMFFEHVFDFL